MDNESIYFDPATGKAKSFPKGKNPPTGWRRVKNPMQLYILYYPHPCGQYINQEGYIQLVFPPDCDKKHPRDWVPLNFQYFDEPTTPAPAKTEHEYYWDPKTNRYYLEPARGRKKIMVPLRDGGLFISYMPPWTAPQLYIDPETGKVQWIHPGKKLPKGWKLLEFSPADTIPTGLSDAEREMLTERRKKALQKLAEDEGVIYIPPDDLYDDAVFEREMNRLGWQRTPDGEWERVPEHKPITQPGPDDVGQLSTFEKLVYAINRMIHSGHFKDDVVEKLKSLLTPEALAVMALLCAIGGPTAIIIGGVLLLFSIGQDFFAFCDALSAITTSGNIRELDSASEKLEKAIVALGIDAVLAWLFARSVKGKASEGGKSIWQEVFERTFNVEETDTGVKIETKPEFKPEYDAEGKPTADSHPGIYAEYEGVINKDTNSLEVNYGTQTWYNATGMKGVVSSLAELMIDALVKFAKKKGLRFVRMKRVASSPQGASLLQKLGFKPRSVRPDGVGLWEKVIAVE
jgi:hypothetical protein